MRQSRSRAVGAAALVLALPLCAVGTPGGAGRPDFREPGTAERARPRTTPAPRPSDARAALVDLRPRFHPGEDIRYRVEIRSVSDVNLPGGDDPSDPLGQRRPAATKPADPRAPAGKPKQKIDQELTLVLRPRSVDPEGAAVVDLIYERVKIRYDYDGEQMEFDSAAKPDPRRASDPLASAGESLLGQLAGGVAGTVVTLTFDPEGRITKAEGGAALGLPGGFAQLNGGSSPGTPQIAESLFGPIVSRKSGGGLVKVGDRWTNEDDLSAGPLGSLRMQTTHTVASSDAKSALVVFTGNAASRTEDRQAPVMLDAATYRGRYDWDTRLGRLKSMETEQETRMTLRGPTGETVSESATTVRVQPAEQKPAP